ncbi:MAG: DUF4258 domain-containing protein [Acidobacteria bacterium]|nr:DUF4258 domain-containing protein [Acidobacteriota bacterium]
MHHSDALFHVVTPLGVTVRVTREWWEMVATVKHPVMAGRLDVVKLALESPDEARQSRTDPEVLLFYKAERPKRWTCAVVKRIDHESFLVTAYPTDAIKEDVRV